MSSEISPKDLFELLKQGKNVCLLDVREAEEILIASLPNSIHIPLMSLGDNLDKLKLLAVDKRYEHWVTVCRSGQRSEMARQLLVAQGINNFCNLTGGINEYARICDPSIERY